LIRRKRPTLRSIPILPAVVLFLLFAPGMVVAQMLTVAETETLVRARYFERMPEEDAVRIGPDGAERLVEMLFDPEEAQSHAQILLALGLCGSPAAMAAILDWSETHAGVATFYGVATLDRVATLDAVASQNRHAPARAGEIDRDTFRAWQALPYALGHLARFDRRAVAHLEALLIAETPIWTFRHHRGARLRNLARRSAASSLALTGLPEARRALDRAGRDASDARFEEHLRNARALHAERAQRVAN
jgi:hypothetical protein